MPKIFYLAWQRMGNSQFCSIVRQNPDLWIAKSRRIIHHHATVERRTTSWDVSLARRDRDFVDRIDLFADGNLTVFDPSAALWVHEHWDTHFVLANRCVFSWLTSWFNKFLAYQDAHEPAPRFGWDSTMPRTEEEQILFFCSLVATRSATYRAWFESGLPFRHFLLEQDDMSALVHELVPGFDFQPPSRIEEGLGDRTWYDHAPDVVHRALERLGIPEHAYTDPYWNIDRSRLAS